MTSVRVFLVFDSLFWSYSNNTNKAPPIPFYPGQSTSPKGGGGITDLPIRSVLYPSHSFHGNAVMATYVWEDDANRLTSFSNDSLIELCLNDLSIIHGDIVRESYIDGSGVVKQWIEDEFVGSGKMFTNCWMDNNCFVLVGAFPWGYPYQVQTMQDALTQFSVPFYFAGDYTSKTSHTWIQDAIESACRVADEMFGINGSVIWFVEI
jgi:monoamine oxidase